ncbi:ZN436 protein, partial [Atractosteus spatula]|nr:ZN436 protein [Atractosteus spatula]
MAEALYLSFFQGQLESVLERVVQAAVRQITDSVGHSLGALLLLIASKEQENRGLRRRMQTCRPGQAPPATRAGETESAAAPSKTASPSSPPSSSSSGCERPKPPDTERQEQRARVLARLQAVLDHVLQTAVTEVRKIVENSFDDLLSELAAKEKENRSLQLRLQLSTEGAAAGPEDSLPTAGSPSSPSTPSAAAHCQKAETQQEPLGCADRTESEGTQRGPSLEAAVSEQQTVLSDAQDWVPVLDRVFGQRWCSELWWQVRELAPSDCQGGGADPECFLSAGSEPTREESREPAPDGSLGPDWGRAERPERDPQGGVAVTAAGEGHSSPSPDQAACGGGSGRRSPGSAMAEQDPPPGSSMLHRLLTETEMEVLQTDRDPQLDCNENLSAEGGPLPASEGEPADSQGPPQRPQAGPRGHQCSRCGKKFSRLPLLKSHQLTHAGDGPFHCGACGKHFLQSARLQTHQQLHTGKKH